MKKMKKILVCLMAALFTLPFACLCFADSSDLPRVDDQADIFTDSEEYELTNRIEKLIDTYGMDFVLYTDDTSGGLDRSTWALDYYEQNGYGIGADQDGSVLFICMESGNRGWFTGIHGQKCRSYYNSNVMNAIDDAIEGDMQNGAYFSAMQTYLNKIDELYSTGTVKKQKNTAANIGIAAVIALICGGITAGVMRSGMKKVRVATEAASYMVPGSFHIRSSRDYYLYSHVTRVKRDNDNGGKSGFSNNLNSSSGGSFSGGGRSF